MIVRRHYVVRGRVQGVGFRFHTERRALAEGLSGFVRNRPDGTVEVEVEGEAEAVARFEWALGQGPPGARVDRLETTELAPTARAEGFTVRG
ncbi:MAG: acylphosphatase [Acidobacteria bacterium]|nr:acylphosphatase [Acidobacteriota bacterium]